MANRKIRQEINLLNREIGGGGDQFSGYVSMILNDYNGSDVYGEIIYKNSDSSSHAIYYIRPISRVVTMLMIYL